MSFVNLLKKYQMIIISAFAVIVCVVASLLGSLYLTRMACNRPYGSFVSGRARL